MKSALLTSLLFTLLVLPSSVWALPCTPMDPEDSTCNVRCNEFAPASKDCRSSVNSEFCDSTCGEYGLCSTCCNVLCDIDLPCTQDCVAYAGETTCGEANKDCDGCGLVCDASSDCDTSCNIAFGGENNDTERSCGWYGVCNASCDNLCDLESACGTDCWAALGTAQTGSEVNCLGTACQSYCSAICGPDATCEQPCYTGEAWTTCGDVVDCNTCGALGDEGEIVGNACQPDSACDTRCMMPGEESADDLIITCHDYTYCESCVDYCSTEILLTLEVSAGAAILDVGDTTGLPPEGLLIVDRGHADQEVLTYEGHDADAPGRIYLSQSACEGPCTTLYAHDVGARVRLIPAYLFESAEEASEALISSGGDNQGGNQGGQPDPGDNEAPDLPPVSGCEQLCVDFLQGRSCGERGICASCSSPDICNSATACTRPCFYDGELSNCGAYEDTTEGDTAACVSCTAACAGNVGCDTTCVSEGDKMTCLSAGAECKGCAEECGPTVSCDEPCVIPGEDPQYTTCGHSSDASDRCQACDSVCSSLEADCGALCIAYDPLAEEETVGSCIYFMDVYDALDGSAPFTCQLPPEFNSPTAGLETAIGGGYMEDCNVENDGGIPEDCGCEMHFQGAQSYARCARQDVHYFGSSNAGIDALWWMSAELSAEAQYFKGGVVGTMYLFGLPLDPSTYEEASPEQGAVAISIPGEPVSSAHLYAQVQPEETCDGGFFDGKSSGLFFRWRNVYFPLIDFGICVPQTLDGSSGFFSWDFEGIDGFSLSANSLAYKGLRAALTLGRFADWSIIPQIGFNLGHIDVDIDTGLPDFSGLADWDVPYFEGMEGWWMGGDVSFPGLGNLPFDIPGLSLAGFPWGSDTPTHFLPNFQGLSFAFDSLDALFNIPSFGNLLRLDIDLSEFRVPISAKMWPDLSFHPHFWGCGDPETGFPLRLPDFRNGKALPLLYRTFPALQGLYELILALNPAMATCIESECEGEWSEDCALLCDEGDMLGDELNCGWRMLLTEIDPYIQQFPALAAEFKGMPMRLGLVMMAYANRHSFWEDETMPEHERPFVEFFYHVDEATGAMTPRYQNSNNGEEFLTAFKLHFDDEALNGYGVCCDQSDPAMCRTPWETLVDYFNGDGIDKTILDGYPADGTISLSNDQSLEVGLTTLSVVEDLPDLSQAFEGEQCTDEDGAATECYACFGTDGPGGELTSCDSVSDCPAYEEGFPDVACVSGECRQPCFDPNSGLPLSAIERRFTPAGSRKFMGMLRNLWNLHNLSNRQFLNAMLATLTIPKVEEMQTGEEGLPDLLGSAVNCSNGEECQPFGKLLSAATFACNPTLPGPYGEMDMSWQGTYLDEHLSVEKELNLFGTKTTIELNLNVDGDYEMNGAIAPSFITAEALPSLVVEADFQQMLTDIGFWGITIEVGVEIVASPLIAGEVDVDFYTGWHRRGMDTDFIGVLGLNLADIDINGWVRLKLPLFGSKRWSKTLFSVTDDYTYEVPLFEIHSGIESMMGIPFESFQLPPSMCALFEPPELDFSGLLDLGDLIDFGGCGSTDTEGCADVACEAPPPPMCSDEETLVFYSLPGSCDDSDGAPVCLYDTVDLDCSAEGKVCLGGACVSADGCAGTLCETPPADLCLDGGVRRAYAPTGTCTEDDGVPVCDYTFEDLACEAGTLCLDGACESDACASVTCDAPPADVCFNDTLLTVYQVPGACDPSGGDASCSYDAIQIDCAAEGQVCDAGACVTESDECCELGGDTNGDGVLNILDVVVLVNAILNGGDAQCVDLNGDGIVNILDVVQMVNIILNGFEPPDCVPL